MEQSIAKLCLPRFTDCTFKSEIIELPEDFITFLLADGIHVPGKATDCADGWGSGGEDEDEDAGFNFPAARRKAKTACDAVACWCHAGFLPVRQFYRSAATSV